MEGYPMKKLFTSRRLAVAAAGGLLVALSLSGVAQAVTDTIFQYTAAKTGYFAIHPMAMVPDGADSASTYHVGWNGAGLHTTGGGCFSTSVNLPNGATMTALDIWYSSGTGGNPQMVILRYKVADGTSDFVADRFFKDDSATRKGGTAPINVAFAVADNAHYTYGFGTCLTANDSFYGARITYTYTNAGD
jgi:hypothetical protein